MHKKKFAASFRFQLGSSGGCTVEDWKFAQQDPSEALAKLHSFSIKKKHARGEVEARITVKEFATAKATEMKFFAVADIELNQKSMTFQPSGWSETLAGALAECLQEIEVFVPKPVAAPTAAPKEKLFGNLRKFEYESPELPPESSEDGAQL